MPVHAAGQRKRKSDARAAETGHLASLQQAVVAQDAVRQRVQDVLLGLHRQCLELPALAQATPAGTWAQLAARLGVSDAHLDRAADSLKALTWSDRLPEPYLAEGHVLLDTFRIHLQDVSPLPSDPSQGDAWILDNLKINLLRATPVPGASSPKSNGRM